MQINSKLHARKLPSVYEGPIDNIILAGVEFVTPFFRATGHTANMITAYAFFCGLAAAYFVYRGFLFSFIISTSLAYFFDCVDGFYARKYNQVSQFGDIIDHVSDILTNVLMIYCFYLRFKPYITVLAIVFIIIPLYVVPLLLMVGYLGCQQTYIQHNQQDVGETLDVFKHFCASPKDLVWLRYFSCGTFKAFTILVVVIFSVIDRNIR